MGGAVAFCVINEVTCLITAQERLARENKRLIALFEKSPLFIAFLRRTNLPQQLRQRERLVPQDDVSLKGIRVCLSVRRRSQ